VGLTYFSGRRWRRGTPGRPLQQPLESSQHGGIIGQVFHHAEDDDGVIGIRRLVRQEVLVQHLGGELQSVYQVRQKLLRLLGDRQAGDLNATPAGMFHESAPAGAHVEDAIAGLEPTGLDGKVELAALSRFQRFIVALEHRLRITARRVEKLEIEVVGELVVGRDRLPVGRKRPISHGARRRHSSYRGWRSLNVPRRLTNPSMSPTTSRLPAM